MASNKGASKAAHQLLANDVFGNGVKVKMMGEEVGYDDGAGVLDDKQVGTAIDTGPSDWDISYNSTDRKVTVSNTSKVDFGESNVGTVVELVLDPEDGTGRYVVVDEPNDPQLTGETYSFPAGEIEYVLGAV